MKLAKAIELGEEAVRSLKDHKFPDHADAVELGIEALKRFQHYRRDTVNSILDPLPGETADD